MRVLMIHNYYQQGGGEDIIFEQEVALLREYGLTVETLLFTNENFDGTFVGDTRSAVQAMYNVQSGRRLRKVMRQFQPDVVHIHNLFYTASASVIRVAKLCGVPVVMTLHNYRLVCVNGLLMRKDRIPCELCLTKILPLAGIQNACFQGSRTKSAHLVALTVLHKLTGIWKQADRFIVLTDFARQKILRSSLKPQPAQVYVKPNFVADTGYTGIEKREDFFLYVGRLSVEKGIRVLLQAAEAYTFPLHIIGDGPLVPEVISHTENRLNTYYKGKQPREVVLDAMKRCRALIVPSLWYEGLPTVILEAFAAGTPVLCSDQENLNQIVQDGQTGLLFQTGNGLDLAQVIRKFCQDVDEQQRLSVNAYSYYQAYYTKEAAIQSALSLYQTLIDERSQ